MVDAWALAKGADSKTNSEATIAPVSRAGSLVVADWAGCCRIDTPELPMPMIPMSGTIIAITGGFRMVLSLRVRPP
jgi:hypothetical protein